MKYKPVDVVVSLRRARLLHADSTRARRELGDGVSRGELFRRHVAELRSRCAVKKLQTITRNLVRSSNPVIKVNVLEWLITVSPGQVLSVEFLDSGHVLDEDVIAALSLLDAVDVFLQTKV